MKSPEEFGFEDSRFFIRREFHMNLGFLKTFGKFLGRHYSSGDICLLIYLLIEVNGSKNSASG